MNQTRGNMMEKSTNQNYLMVLPVQFHTLENGVAACESAFVEHLKLLHNQIGNEKKMVILAPEMSVEKYESLRDYLSEVSAVDDGICVATCYPGNISRVRYFLLHSWRVAPKLWKAVAKASVVHSGPSLDLLTPFEVFALIFAWLRGKPSIFVIDIDNRKSAYMSYKTGRISKKSYLLCQYVYNPYIGLQTWLAARFCSLCLLKGKALAEHYQLQGKTNVKNFYDTAHSIEYVISDDELEQKKQSFLSRQNLRVAYFGRLTAYKGIKDMIDAVAEVAAGGLEISFIIIGDGEQRRELEQYALEQGLEKQVKFTGAVAYGLPLFSMLSDVDILLAAPLQEDTPRSVFDAMAAGIGIVGYNTYYYDDLQHTGAVRVCEWRDISGMAALLQRLATDGKSDLLEMMEKGRNFARDNTQEVWLKKRMGWLLEAIS